MSINYKNPRVVFDGMTNRVEKAREQWEQTMDVIDLELWVYAVQNRQLYADLQHSIAYIHNHRMGPK